MAKKSSGSKETEFNRQFDSNVVGQGCDGFIYMKRLHHLRNSYVKTWCSFQNKILSVFENKNGKHFEDINIEICHVTPLIKSGNNSFYFEVRHEWSTYHFGTKDYKEYNKWINTLQSESLKSKPESDILHRNALFKSYSREESISQFESTSSVFISDSNLSKPLENGDIYDEVTSPGVGNFSRNSPKGSIHSDNVFDNEKRGENDDGRNDKSKQNSESLVMDKFKFMADLERQIRASFVLYISIKCAWLFSCEICYTKCLYVYVILVLFYSGPGTGRTINGQTPELRIALGN